SRLAMSSVFSSRRRHTRSKRDWSSDVCSSDLEKYAELALKKGVNLQKGQALMINAPIEGAEFTRIVVRKAYELGAKDVHINWAEIGRASCRERVEGCVEALAGKRQRVEGERVD